MKSWTELSYSWLLRFNAIASWDCYQNISSQTSVYIYAPHSVMLWIHWSFMCVNMSCVKTYFVCFYRFYHFLKCFCGFSLLFHIYISYILIENLIPDICTYASFWKHINKKLKLCFNHTNEHLDDILGWISIINIFINYI